MSLSGDVSPQVGWMGQSSLTSSIVEYVSGKYLGMKKEKKKKDGTSI
jgi:hypothetical protein